MKNDHRLLFGIMQDARLAHAYELYKYAIIYAYYIAGVNKNLQLTYYLSRIVKDMRIDEANKN